MLAKTRAKMTKLKELKAALEAATPGEWDYFIASNADRPNSQVLDSNDDNLLTHSKGITGRAQSDVEFIALAHNLMPTLLEAIDLLETVGSARACQDHEFDVDAWFKQVRSLLGDLK